MAATTAIFIGVVITSTGISLAGDKNTWRHPVRTLKSVANLRKTPIIGRKARATVRDYYRKDFHPDDHDAVALREQWADALFGEDGTLVDKLVA